MSTPSNMTSPSAIPLPGKSVTADALPRLVTALCLLTLFLLPWCWFPPFPWLHEHGQWSDVVFALTALAWACERLCARQWPVWRGADAALAVYLALAALSWALVTKDKTAGALKLLGMAELCALALITADLCARPGVMVMLVRVTVATTLLTCLAAWLGLALFYAGWDTRLTGTYGDLMASAWYARVQAGTYHPNLLANFCIYALAVTGQRENALPAWWRRVSLAALCVTVLLTFSRGILGFGLALLLQNARTANIKKLAGAYAAVCFVLLICMTMWNLSLNPARPLAASIGDSSDSVRWQTMTSAWQTFVAHPWLGTGPATVAGHGKQQPMDAHMTPLNIAATLGAPALAAFAAVFVLLWRGRRRPLNMALWGGLAGVALDAVASDVEDFRHVWALIGMLLADSGQEPGKR
ncbi:MAG: O-antigen ligase family protein [Blastocatellia bacterium]